MPSGVIFLLVFVCGRGGRRLSLRIRFLRLAFMNLRLPRVRTRLAALGPVSLPASAARAVLAALCVTGALLLAGCAAQKPAPAVEHVPLRVSHWRFSRISVTIFMTSPKRVRRRRKAGEKRSSEFDTSYFLIRCTAVGVVNPQNR